MKSPWCSGRHVSLQKHNMRLKPLSHTILNILKISLPILTNQATEFKVDIWKCSLFLRPFIGEPDT